MEKSEIEQGILDNNKILYAKLKELDKAVIALADAERDYHIAKARKAATLKIDGESVTLIDTLCKGDDHVADARYKYTLAESNLKALFTKIGSVRDTMSCYQSMLSQLKAEMNLK
jgi:hypothetical protein